ncbi:MAG: CBS domain-containing protein [Chloroflexota bacterium]|nr:CBS domain-containing protein [Chloroflexota bacterium]
MPQPDTSQRGARHTKQLGDTAARIGRLELRTEPARLVARPEPLSVRRGTPLGEALRQMQQAQGEALLVCDGRRLVGIFTEHDVLTRVIGRNVPADRPIDELMTAQPRTLHADATLHDALAAMENGGYRNLPLVDTDGAPVALLRQQDVLAYVAEAFPQEILNLPPRPHQLMEEPEGA